MIFNKKEPENIFEYTGPTSLKKIEGRLLEIEQEKSVRAHNAQENYSGIIEDQIEEEEIEHLDIEKKQLELKRQFILDQRNSWKSRGIWNIIVPIIVSVATVYFVSLL